MNHLQNSSELDEAAKLIGNLLITIPESHQYDVFHDICSPDSFNDTPGGTTFFATPPAQVESQTKDETPTAPLISGITPLNSDSEYIGDQLELLLSNLCQQSGFQTAIVADDQGLPIGGYNPPIDVDRLAAFTSVLSMAIDKTPYFFNNSEANNISIDISYLDKVVVRKFLIDDIPFLLLIICPQEIDERAYIELFSDQITSLLKR